jgi:hypothetical protein
MQGSTDFLSLFCYVLALHNVCRIFVRHMQEAGSSERESAAPNGSLSKPFLSRAFLELFALFLATTPCAAPQHVVAALQHHNAQHSREQANFSDGFQLLPHLPPLFSTAGSAESVSHLSLHAAYIWQVLQALGGTTSALRREWYGTTSVSVTAATAFAAVYREWLDVVREQLLLGLSHLHAVWQQQYAGGSNNEQSCKPEHTSSSSSSADSAACSCDELFGALIVPVRAFLTAPHASKLLTASAATASSSTQPPAAPSAPACQVLAVVFALYLREECQHEVLHIVVSAYLHLLHSLALCTAARPCTASQPRLPYRLQWAGGSEHSAPPLLHAKGVDVLGRAARIVQTCYEECELGMATIVNSILRFTVAYTTHTLFGSDVGVCGGAPSNAALLIAMCLSSATASASSSSSASKSRSKAALSAALSVGYDYYKPRRAHVMAETFEPGPHSSDVLCAALHATLQVLSAHVFRPFRSSALHLRRVLTTHSHSTSSKEEQKDTALLPPQPIGRAVAYTFHSAALALMHAVRAVRLMWAHRQRWPRAAQMKSHTRMEQSLRSMVCTLCRAGLCCAECSLLL